MAISENSIVRFLQDSDSAEFNSFIQQLNAQGIYLGKLIGEGVIAQIYQLKDKTGRVIPSAVIRIEPESSGGEVQSPAVIPVLAKFKSKNFESAIVPYAEEGGYTSEDIKKTLAVLNSAGLLGHIADLTANDVNHQFMKLPGIDVPVLVDLNAISNEAGGLKGMGGVAQFAEKHQFSLAEIEASKASHADMVLLNRARQNLIDSVRRDLESAGITLPQEKVREVG
jgi:hypothetical protein